VAARFFLLGPTASGKTAVALELAGLLDAEILSLDSMLVYRGMDIGTAKPSAAELAAVPHHLINLVEASEEFSVARYLQAAAAAEAAVQARGKKILYVGGTIMWFKALVFGLLDIPDTSPELQRELDTELQQNGPSALRAQLEAVDHNAAQRIHPNDTRRLVRALGVWRTTGKSMSDWQEQWGQRTTIGEPAALLEWPREVLHQRVASRFQAMVDAGLLQEIQTLLDGKGFSRSAGKAIGYWQLRDYLEGRCSLEDALQRAVFKTNVLIRRQMTWLRSFTDLRRVAMQPEQAASVVAARLATAWSS
jgi:tRNA dimethylallyltransferase